MQLTGRQRAFLGAFLDLYHQTQEALHYTQIAKKLGVSAITAYDMLRILEKRGLVRSEYMQHEAKRGRTSIVFLPTDEAHQIVTSLKGKVNEPHDWEQVREHVLKTLSTHQTEDYNELVQELLERLPICTTPMLFITEMIAAVIISLQLSHSDLIEKLRTAGFPHETGLSALEGLAVGLTFAERVNRSFLKVILVQNKRYAEMLASISGEHREGLTKFVDEVMGAMNPPATPVEEKE
jgi:DNA-binding MarR family transcriptional regulator